MRNPIIMLLSLSHFQSTMQNISSRLFAFHTSGTTTPPNAFKGIFPTLFFCLVVMAFVFRVLFVLCVVFTRNLLTFCVCATLSSVPTNVNGIQQTQLQQQQQQQYHRQAMTTREQRTPQIHSLTFTFIRSPLFVQEINIISIIFLAKKQQDCSFHRNTMALSPSFRALFFTLCSSFFFSFLYTSRFGSHFFFFYLFHRYTIVAYTERVLSMCARVLNSNSYRLMLYRCENMCICAMCTVTFRWMRTNAIH